MKYMQMKSRLLILYIVTGAILIGAGVWFWYTSRLAQEGVFEEPASLGEQLFEQVEQSANVAEEVPQTNPFNKPTNPLKDVYNNPFE